MTGFFDQAACRGMNANIFHPGPGDASYTHLAKSVCAECPVRLECLEWALVEGEWKGIWGGLSAVQRRAIARKRGNPPRERPHAPCGTHAAYGRHIRRGEVPCDQCKTARAIWKQLTRPSRAKQPAA